MSERGEHFVQSLERGLAVIRAFGPDDPALTLSDVAQRQLRVLDPERLDHREPALERLDEVLAAFAHNVSSVSWASFTAEFAAGTPA